MNRKIFFGRNGGPVTEVPRHRLADLKPQLVLDTASLFLERTNLCHVNGPEEQIKAFVQEAYSVWGKFGSEGDLIAVRMIELPDASVAEIEFIGRLQQPKPSLAADIIPVVIDSEGNSFFVLIHRKWDPGKGKIALIGGNQEVIGFYFQTPAATLQMEAMEEANLVLVPQLGSEPPFFHQPFIPCVPVTVKIRQREVAEVESNLILLGTYETSAEEERPHLQAKRINWTTAYLLPIRVDFPVDKEMLKRWFKAGDDAEKMAFVNPETDPYPEFGIGHHKTIFDEAKKMAPATAALRAWRFSVIDIRNKGRTRSCPLHPRFRSLFGALGEAVLYNNGYISQPTPTTQEKRRDR
jgi:8-oxo-dGTP pyrophosphatase MutT (NUDIX family)